MTVLIGLGAYKIRGRCDNWWPSQSDEDEPSSANVRSRETTNTGETIVASGIKRRRISSEETNPLVSESQLSDLLQQLDVAASERRLLEQRTLKLLGWLQQVVPFKTGFSDPGLPLEGPEC